MHIYTNNTLYDLRGFSIISEGVIPNEMLIMLTTPAYHDAFLKGVWKEELSSDEIVKRLTRDFSVKFHGYWLIDQSNGELASTSWYEITNLEFINDKKSPSLSLFAQDLIEKENIKQIIWYSETFTHSNYWGKGYAKMLTDLNFEDIQSSADNSGKIIVLLRMRDDNLKIININEKRGFKRTGIRLPCTLNSNLFHEFWYKVFD